jgi:REase_MTES_1575
MPWTQVIDRELQSTGGVATRAQLLRSVPDTVIDGQIGRGQLQRVFPHVYARRGPAVSGPVLLRAALLHAGEASALSHLTALHVWGAQPLSHPVHLTISQDSRRAGAQGLVVHRRNGFRIDEHCSVVRGLRVTALPRSLVDAWPLLPMPRRRPLLLDLVRERAVATSDVRAALAERPNVGGHRALAQAIELAAAGCESELEAMGVLSVFTHRSVPPSIGQFAVSVEGRRRKLDRAWPEVCLAVELDGARFHTDPEARQRDLARDAALASIGWLVLRFTYADVLRDPDGVRARVLAVYAMRAAQLG